MFTTSYPAYSHEERRIIVGILQLGSVVAIPETPAHELAALKTALNDSATWADFRRTCPAGYWKQALEQFEIWDDPVPADDDPFDRMETIPGCQDGDWPPWPAQEMLCWLPESILDAFGETGSSMISGPSLSIDVGLLDDFVPAMEDLGYECILDDDLIGWASFDEPADPAWRYEPPSGDEVSPSRHFS